MKKALSIVLMAALSLTMIFSMTGCGGPTDEQLNKMEELMSKYETAVADCDAEYAKFAEAAGDDENLADINNSLDEVKNLLTETRKTFDENKNSYSEEQADEVIASLDEQVKKCEVFLKTLQDANAAIAASEK